jgi:DNA-directed RNA polymerase specialized sigma24 family protein
MQRKAALQQAAGLSAFRPGGKGPSESDDDVPLRKALSSALEALPPRNAEVIRLHLQGFTIEEIAGFRGTTVFQARHHFYRGIEKLKAKIGIDRGTR